MIGPKLCLRPCLHCRTGVRRPVRQKELAIICLRQFLAGLALSTTLGGVAWTRAASVALPAARDNTLFEDAAGSVSNGIGSFFFAGRTNQTGQSIRRGL